MAAHCELMSKAINSVKRKDM